jgi:hypothetical protein
LSGLASGFRSGHTSFLKIRIVLLGALALLAAGCGHGHDSGWRLLVWSDRDGDRALYAVDVGNGKSARMMRAGAAYAEDPIPSPDGRTLFVPGRRP